MRSSATADGHDRRPVHAAPCPRSPPRREPTVPHWVRTDRWRTIPGPSPADCSACARSPARSRVPRPSRTNRAAPPPARTCARTWRSTGSCNPPAAAPARRRRRGSGDAAPCPGPIAPEVRRPRAVPGPARTRLPGWSPSARTRAPGDRPPGGPPSRRRDVPVPSVDLRRTTRARLPGPAIGVPIGDTVPGRDRHEGGAARDPLIATRPPGTAEATTVRIRPDDDEAKDLDRELSRRIEQWETLPANSDEARQVYERDIFPLVCERMRRVGRQNPRARLAFVPVGTQPYSPLLATLANPADAVELLHTTGSRDVARRVAETLAGEGPVRVRLRPCGDGSEGARIIEAVEGAWLAAGAPPAHRVVVDITSGRKATAAVLGALAAVKGFRQAYIEASPSRVHRLYMIGERYVPLAAVGAAVGADRRSEGLVLLEAGAFAAAEKAFRDAEQASGGAPLDRSARAAASGLAAWTRLDFAAAARALRRACRAAPEDAVALRELLETAAGAAREIAESGGDAVRHAVALLAVQLDRQRNPLARAGLARQPAGRGLARLGLSEVRARARTLARRLGLRRVEEERRDPFRLGVRVAALLRDDDAR
ncbi:MAG: hypothetical protein D6738_08635 [Acidobacteria bacterium]|nr:MAG: hypothetical protein D6738_08635 [Acidobacteriota bacterium]